MALMGAPGPRRCCYCLNLAWIKHRFSPGTPVFLMTSCLVISPTSPGSPPLAEDLESVGFHVIGAALRNNLVQDAVRLAPDVVVFHEATPDDALFESTALLLATAPRPVVVFTSDPDAEKMARALRAGIHAWVVD